MPLRPAAALSVLLAAWPAAATAVQASTVRTSTAAGATARPAASASRPVLTIVAMDYAFRVPATAAAGPTTVRLVNRGAHMHHVQLVWLAPGRGVQDLLREWKPGRPNPAFMTPDGGPTAAVGGQTLEGEVVLRPGRYAVLCWVPAADGQLHLQKGMFGQFDVTAPPARAPRPAALPAPDVRIAMADYGYLVPAVRPGRRVVRVVNRGPQAHELFMVRLAPGRTLQDAVHWAERGQTGVAPGRTVGGVAALAPGDSGQFAVRFAPGEYALLCFVPDQEDGVGRPHTQHGMMRQLTVR